MVGKGILINNLCSPDKGSSKSGYTRIGEHNNKLFIIKGVAVMKVALKKYLVCRVTIRLSEMPQVFR
ncbi:Uncharacterized [Syntrophomonas zehnderi OL-4]|uniref:Uncharacterized n=1 Tax=Syntrophomonas zehnderi OL-4 TaxID=690567 RepID=A0A0E4GAF1_9FIRM|nr:Uncharacterized [Syntrophomonas zehnderi OL-4]